MPHIPHIDPEGIQRDIREASTAHALRPGAVRRAGLAAALESVGEAFGVSPGEREARIKRALALDEQRALDEPIPEVLQRQFIDADYTIRRRENPALTKEQHEQEFAGNMGALTRRDVNEAIELLRLRSTQGASEGRTARGAGPKPLDLAAAITRESDDLRQEIGGTKAIQERGISSDEIQMTAAFRAAVKTNDPRLEELRLIQRALAFASDNPMQGKTPDESRAIVARRALQNLQERMEAGEKFHPVIEKVMRQLAGSIETTSPGFFGRLMGKEPKKVLKEKFGSGNK